MNWQQSTGYGGVVPQTLIQNPQDGEFMRYSGATKYWQNQTYTPPPPFQPNTSISTWYFSPGWLPPEGASNAPIQGQNDGSTKRAFNAGTINTNYNSWSPATLNDGSAYLITCSLSFDISWSGSPVDNAVYAFNINLVDNANGGASYGFDEQTIYSTGTGGIPSVGSLNLTTIFYNNLPSGSALPVLQLRLTTPNTGAINWTFYLNNFSIIQLPGITLA
jgi:hypothetical protein